MKSLIWKECHENLKWVVLPIFLIVGPMCLAGAFPVLNKAILFYVSIVAALFGAVLGFLQVFFEASGDKRSLLMHRPLSGSRIFLGKAVAGVGLYLLALGLPFAVAVALAATPGHVSQPFSWGMALPWLADNLTGLVWYFAGMLAAQREARWYGSRCLGLAAALFCSIVVWTLPEFWHALVAIVLLGGLVAVAAWGSFIAGGAYAPQPRLAKIALVFTYLAGLLALSFTGKCFLGAWLERQVDHNDLIDRKGRVLLVQTASGKYESVTDLEGRLPRELQGQRLDRYALDQIVSPSASGGDPKTRSYRQPNRFRLEYANETHPGGEEWWYVPERGRVLGYNEKTKQFLGSFGPDGFVPPDEQPRERFQGEVAHGSVLYLAIAPPYLAFPGGVYFVNFEKRALQTLFVPSAGETVRWADEWEDKKLKLSLAFVVTDRAVYVVDEAGSRVFSVPLAADQEGYQLRRAGRLEDPQRYWISYQPRWYLKPDALETMPAYFVVYDATGREINRQTVPALPGIARAVYPSQAVVEPSTAHAWFGLVTSPAEAAILVGTRQSLESDVRGNNGTEVWLLLQFLILGTQFFIPGVRWSPSANAGLVFGFVALLLLSAALCAFICFLLAYRYSFSRPRCFGWSLCGFLFGWVGLLLMLALQEWPARIACPKCRKQRVVTRPTCEYCGAAHASPALDGTEIFEATAATPQAALVGS
jgi:hypothetical protein